MLFPHPCSSVTENINKRSVELYTMSSNRGRRITLKSRYGKTVHAKYSANRYTGLLFNNRSFLRFYSQHEHNASLISIIEVQLLKPLQIYNFLNNLEKFLKNLACRRHAILLTPYKRSAVWGPRRDDSLHQLINHLPIQIFLLHVTNIVTF